MRTQRTLGFLFVLFLPATYLFADDSIELRVESGRLAVKSAAIALEATLPSVAVQYEDGGPTKRWQPNNAATVEIDLETTPLGRASVTSTTWTRENGERLVYEVLALEKHDGFVLRARYYNGTDQPVRLERFNMLDAQPGKFQLSGKPTDWTLSSNRLPTPCFETLETMQKRQQLAPESAFQLRCEDAATFYTDAGTKGLLIGGLEDFADVMTTTSVDDQGQCSINVSSEMTQVLVDPGETRQSERVLVMLKPWREATRDRAKWITTVNPPMPNIEPVFGWCSWYSVFMNVNQDQIESISEVVKANRGKLPMDVVQIDEGWQIGRHDWRANTKFPDGMEAMARTIDETGAAAGIWLSLVRPSSKRRIDGEVVELQPYGGGELIRTFDEDWYEGYLEGKPNFQLLDPTHPDVQDYIRTTLYRMVKQGYRYFKLDFNDLSGEFKRRYNPKMTRFQAQRELFRIYREAIGPDNYLMLCSAEPFRIGVGYGNASRTGTDTETRKGFLPEHDQFGKPTTGHGLYYAILQTVASCADNGLLMAGDPDVTYVGPKQGVTAEELTCFHNIVGLYGGAVMVSDMLFEDKYDDPKRLRWLEIINQPSREKGIPFAGGQDVHGKEFGFIAKRPWGDFAAVAVWNPEHEGTANLGISHVPTEFLGDHFHVWSFWEEEYLGVKDSSFLEKDVPAYNSRLFRLTPVDPDGGPTLIGSNLHITMGGAEVQNVSSSTDGLSITLSPNAGATKGQLWFHSQRPLQVTSNNARVYRTESDGVYVVLIKDRSRDRAMQVDLTISDKVPPLLDRSVKEFDETSILPLPR